MASTRKPKRRVTGKNRNPLTPPQEKGLCGFVLGIWRKLFPNVKTQSPTLKRIEEKYNGRYRSFEEDLKVMETFGMNMMKDGYEDEAFNPDVNVQTPQPQSDAKPFPQPATPRNPGKNAKVVTKEVELRALPFALDKGTTTSKVSKTGLPEDVIYIEGNVRQGTPAEMVTTSNYGTDSDQNLNPNDTVSVKDNLVFSYLGQCWYAGSAAALTGAPLGVGVAKTQYSEVKLVSGLIAAGVGMDAPTDVGVCFAVPYTEQAKFEEWRDTLLSLTDTTLRWTYLKQPGEVTLAQVDVLPEGFAPLYWCLRCGIPIEGSTVVLIDIGHYTTDCSLVDCRQGIKFNKFTSKSLTFAMSQFAERVATEAKVPNPESHQLIKAIVGNGKYRRGFNSFDLNPYLPNLRAGFASNLKGKLEEWFNFVETDIDMVLIVGGGGSFFYPELQRVFNEANLECMLVPHARSAPVLGQYYYETMALSRRL